MAKSVKKLAKPQRPALPEKLQRSLDQRRASPTGPPATKTSPRSSAHRQGATRQKRG